MEKKQQASGTLANLTGIPLKRAKFVKPVTSPTTRTPESQFTVGSDNRARDITMELTATGVLCFGSDTVIFVPLANVLEVE